MPRGRGGRGSNQNGSAGGNGGRGNNNNGGGRNNNNNNNGNPYCNHCKRNGHSTADCYKKNQNGNGNSNNQNNRNNNNQNKSNVTKACSKCGGWHLDKDCKTPEKNSNGQPIVCKHCKGPHFNAACPSKHDPNYTGSTNGNEYSASNKSAPTVGGYSLTMSGLVIRPCYYCGEPHIPSMCPHKDVLAPQVDAYGPPVVSTSGVFSPQHPERYYGIIPVSHSDNRFTDHDDYDEDPIAHHPYRIAEQPQPEYPNTGLYFYDGQTFGRGNPPREYHRPLARQADGDIEMVDVDSCLCCD